MIEDSLVMLRNLIDDTASLSYTDERLLELLYISAVYVNMDIGATYTISVSGQTIDPDTDSSFDILVSYKAACLLTRSTQNSYAKSDFTVTDGPSTVNLKGAAASIKLSADSYCSQYERSKMLYLMGNSSFGGGLAISTPNSSS
jgi:hypothetical protein